MDARPQLTSPVSGEKLGDADCKQLKRTPLVSCRPQVAGFGTGPARP